MVKMATCDVNILKSALGIQQTGPRTVIVPANPIIWDDGTSYEYLTLVASTDFGQAYISKRDVPAGTPLTDTEYWIPAASYNAQLAAIHRSLSNRTKFFATVNDMIADNNANTGDTCVTLGFHAPNDGGGALYTSGSTGSADGWSVIQGNGVVYSLVMPDELDFRVTGATAGENCTALLNSALAYCAEKGVRLFVPAGNWVVDPITLPNYVAIRGNYSDYYTQREPSQSKSATVLSFNPVENEACITLGYSNSLNDIYVNANALTITENRELLNPVPDGIGDYGNWIIKNESVSNVTGITMGQNAAYIRNVQVYGANIGYNLLLAGKLSHCFANNCNIGFKLSSDSELIDCSAQAVYRSGFQVNTNNNTLIGCRVDSSYNYGVEVFANNNEIDILGDFIGESLVHITGSYNTVKATSKRFSVNHSVTSIGTPSQLSGLILIDGAASENIFNCGIGTEAFNGRYAAQQIALFNDTTETEYNTFITNRTIPNFSAASGFTYNNLTSTFGRTYPADTGKSSYTCVFTNAIVMANGGKYYGYSSDAYKTFPSA